MQRRGFIILLAATIVVVALAVVALATGDRDVSQAAAGTRAFPQLAARLADLEWLRVSHGAVKVSLHRTGAGWVVADKGDYPALPGKVRQALLGLADLTLVEPKTRRPELYPRLEVDNPSGGKSTLVSVTDKTGATVAALIVGKRSTDRLGAGNDGVYVRRPDDVQSWLAGGSLDVSGDLLSWVDRRIIDIPGKRIASVTLTGADGTALVISRAAPDGKFAVKDAPPDTTFKNETVVEEPTTALETVDLDDVKPAGEMPVPSSGVTTAAFTTFDGLTVHVRLFQNDNHDWVAIDASGTDKAADEAKAINARVLRWSYAIPSYKVKMLQTKLADLVAPPKPS